MLKPSSRRHFLQSTVAAAAIADSGHALTAAASSASSVLSGAAIEQEIDRRATWHHSQRSLDVDYYRIGRKLAYPLPVRSLSIPKMVVPSINDYPWSIWMLWSLEDRIQSLAWAAEWKQDAQLAATASHDLLALADFPRFCQLEKPDLAAGHAGRLLWSATRDWHWVEPRLKDKLRAACARHVEEVFPLFAKHYGTVRSKADLQPVAPSYDKLHNIALIGTIGATLTANVIRHPRAAQMNDVIRAVFESILDARHTGYTEAVAYDGYVLDFIADWLITLPEADRDKILDHPRFDDCLQQSYRLSAPGAMEQVAALADVEPREMPFHLSAQGKLARWRPSPLRGWYLRQCNPAWMRADVLGLLRDLVNGLHGTAPSEPCSNAHYAVVLRSGWQKADCAAVMSCTNSPTGHLPPDNGTLVIGAAGQWILSDPGYQQYMDGEERVFTIGPAAHNSPVINGLQQTTKRPRLVALDQNHAVVDLSGCYPAALTGRTVKRHLWRSDRRFVILADEIAGEVATSVSYHWHGHPKAAWWAENGQLLIRLDSTSLWLATPHLSLDLVAVARLPGSRGQLTAIATIDQAPPVLWWIFALGDRPPAASIGASGRTITLAGLSFSV